MDSINYLMQKEISLALDTALGSYFLMIMIMIMIMNLFVSPLKYNENVPSMSPLKVDEKVKKRKGLKILTPYKLLSRFSILLVQIKAGNNSNEPKNEVRKILYLLFVSA